VGVFFFLLLVFGTIGLVLYFVPTLVAVVRGTPDRGAVFAVNAFLGWTVLGWVAAMAMALRGTGSSRRVPPARTPVDHDAPIYETRVLEAAAAELPDDPFANL
jgi:hypothetical protein